MHIRHSSVRRPMACVAIALSSLFVFSACGPQIPSATPSNNTEHSQSQKNDASHSPAQLPDAHAMTGLVNVEDISDPVPVSGNFTQHLPATVNDVEGNTVTVTSTERILALDLYGTLSRTLIGLGLGEKIVGRSISSTETMLKDVPVVTQNGHSLNVEAILALDPSLIIADRSIGPREAIDQLRAAGIPVVLVDPERSMDNITELISQVAAAIGMEEAGTALSKRSEQEVEEAKEKIASWAPSTPLEAAFLYVRGSGGIFFILGQKEGASSLIEALGAKDAAKEKGITSTTSADAEALVALNPEVVFVMSSGLASTGGIDGLVGRAGMAQTRAGHNQRVVAIPDGSALSFGPQTGQTLEKIARALYGVPNEEK